MKNKISVEIYQPRKMCASQWGLYEALNSYHFIRAFYLTRFSIRFHTNSQRNFLGCIFFSSPVRQRPMMVGIIHGES